MSAPPLALHEATIRQHCKVLHLPTVADQCGPLGAQAVREGHTHLGYLDALLAAEVDERERHAIARRLKEAHLPRLKTLDEFDFSQAPKVSATQIRTLADGDYIARTEPVVLIGDCGTGKTHLLTGLCVAACRQRRRVRFTTAAGLVNELVEAKHTMQLARVLARWARYDVIAIDEVGYVPLADVGAELLFQIIADRTERAALLLTTNLPFSEWTQVIPNARSVQSRARPHHRPGAHHRHGPRVLSVSPHEREAAEERLIRRRGRGRCRTRGRPDRAHRSLDNRRRLSTSAHRHHRRSLRYLKKKNVRQPGGARFRHHRGARFR